MTNLKYNQHILIVLCDIMQFMHVHFAPSRLYNLHQLAYQLKTFTRRTDVTWKCLQHEQTNSWAVWNKTGSSRSEANRRKTRLKVSRCCGLRAQPGSRYWQ